MFGRLLSKHPPRQKQQDRVRVLDLRVQSCTGLPQSGAVGVVAEASGQRQKLEAMLADMHSAVPQPPSARSEHRSKWS